MQKDLVSGESWVVNSYSDERGVSKNQIGYSNKTSSNTKNNIGKTNIPSSPASHLLGTVLPTPGEAGPASAPFDSLGCVIMASGLGRRFGGNKLLAELGGKPLLQWVLDATQGMFGCRRVVVTRHLPVAELCRRQGVPVVLHQLPYRSDTVRLGLEALMEIGGTERAGAAWAGVSSAPGSSLTGCLFCPGDQPLLRRETVEALARCGAGAPQWIWRAAWEGSPGSPVLFPAWAFEELRHLPEGKGGGVVARRYPERVRLVPVRYPWELADVDRPEDLARLEQLMAAAPEEREGLMADGPAYRGKLRASDPEPPAGSSGSSL